MSLKQVLFNFTLDTERHPVVITDCPTNSCSCTVKKVIQLPMLSERCNSCGNIAIKLKDSALVVQQCEDVAQLIIIGRLVDQFQLSDGNGCPLSEYRITAEYESDQLTNPAYDLTEDDIDGFGCYGIDGEYLKNLVDCTNGGTTLEQDLDTGEITYTNGAGDTFTAEVTSADADNAISTGSDGGSFLDPLDMSKTEYQQNATDVSPALNVTAVGTYTVVTGGVVTLSNVDTVQNIRILRMLFVNITGNFIPGHIGTVHVQASVNAGAFADIYAESWKNNGSSDYLGKVPNLGSLVDVPGVVGAPGVYALQIRMTYQTTTAGAGGSGVSTISASTCRNMLLGIYGNNI